MHSHLVEPSSSGLPPVAACFQPVPWCFPPQPPLQEATYETLLNNGRRGRLPLGVAAAGPAVAAVPAAEGAANVPHVVAAVLSASPAGGAARPVAVVPADDR